MTIKPELNGRIALVTGGSRGIGAAIAVTLAEAGAAVAVNYRQRAAEADAVVAEIKRKGGRAIAVAADVSQTAAVADMVDHVAFALGPIGILVNNAGIAIVRGIDDLTEAEFDATISVNLKSAFLCQAVLPGMRAKKWGRIVNISSVSGLIGNAGQVNYSASKAGILGLTKSIARELASKQVTANCVAPGFITTDMTQVLPQQIKDKVVEIIPLRRFGTAQDVANAVSFLASDKSGYITGQVIAVAGGMTM